MIEQTLIYILIFLAGLTFPLWQKFLLSMIAKQKNNFIDEDLASCDNSAIKTLEENKLKQLKTIKLTGRTGKQTGSYENEIVHISYSSQDDLRSILDGGKVSIYSKLDGEFVHEIKGGLITTTKAESSNSNYVYCLPNGVVFFEEFLIEKKLVPKNV